MANDFLAYPTIRAEHDTHPQQASRGGTKVDDKRTMGLHRQVHGTIVVDACTTR